ncbi:hypothetical protein [Glaciibacter sp. 2TAF33]|uniref:hypothetical protein n=1 Tax=Glaciibacter sp. 2TAF33 TaxID=3233015 RepID=UPI003F8F50E7
MTNLTPGVAAVMQCTHAHGESCASSAPGHTLSALQERVAAATPSKWRDGLVSHVSAGGWVGVELLQPNEAGAGETVGGETVWVWSHSDLTASVSPGLPVAVHAIYHTLAVGRERFNVLVAALG